MLLEVIGVFSVDGNRSSTDNEIPITASSENASMQSVRFLSLDSRGGGARSMSVDRWKDPSVPFGLVRPSSGGYRSRFFFRDFMEVLKVSFGGIVPDGIGWPFWVTT